MTSFFEIPPQRLLFVSSDGPKELADEIVEYLEEEAEIATCRSVNYFWGAFLMEVETHADSAEVAVLLKLRFEGIEVEMKRAA